MKVKRKSNSNSSENSLKEKILRVDISRINLTENLNDGLKCLESYEDSDDSSLDTELFSTFTSFISGDSQKGIEEKPKTEAKTKIKKTPTILPEDNIISYESENVKFLVFKKGTLVHLNGACKLQVLYGCVNAFGYQFYPCEKSYDMFSLRGWPQVYLNINSRPFKQSANLVEEMLNKHFASNTVAKIVKDLDQDSVVVCLSPFKEWFLSYVQKNCPTNLLPVLEDGFNLSYAENPNEYGLKIGENWSNLIKCDSKDIKTMICGGKSVGKSTLLRYLINKCLSFHQQICIIDLDPGQSEFTMSACVSIIMIDTPVFGPNFTHQIQPIKSISQNIDITYSPSNYLNAVSELSSFYLSMKSLPTLINTMGFAKGIGLEITSAVIAILNPSAVLEIRSSKGKKNFPKELKSEIVRKECTSFLPDFKTNFDYKHIVVPMSFDEEDVKSNYKPAGYFCRDLSTISYFGKIVDMNLSLRSWFLPMYKVNLGSITVLDENYATIVPENEAKVINANVVALCSKIESTNNDSSLYNCHGYGIVRCIIKDEIVLITPIIEEQLEVVTHFVVGIVQIPSSMLMEEGSYDKPIPYFSTGCISDLTSVPRRSYLSRKST